MSEAAATRDEIARLFGRAAFGATAADLDRWTGRPWAEAVSHLVDIPSPDGRALQFDDTQRAAIERSGQNTTDYNLIRNAQKWWLERMRNTKYPLEERMTLFWHGHFATAVRAPYPDVAMIMGQNDMMRRHSLGNFRTLLKAMTLDSAMMEWLDGARNSLPVPNENFGRELLELFTLGKFPQVYGESDVREAARVLTGWVNDTGLRKANFNAAGHDTGSKSVLGTTIAHNAEREYLDLLEVAMAQPVASRFIAAKLVANFAYAPDLTNLLTRPDPLVAAVSDTLRQTNWDLRAAMRTLLLSSEFRNGDAKAQRLLVRQPVELIVAACKTLDIAANRDEFTYASYLMGQDLFLPPNVGGFATGLAWLSPSTMLGRYFLGMVLDKYRPNDLPAADNLAGWARKFGLGSLTPETTTAIGDFVASSSKQTGQTRQAGVMILLMTSPDWAVI